MTHCLSELTVVTTRLTAQYTAASAAAAGNLGTTLVSFMMVLALLLALSVSLCCCGSGGGAHHHHASHDAAVAVAGDSGLNQLVLWNEFWLQNCNASSFPRLSSFGITANAGNAQNGAAVTIVGAGSIQGQHRMGPFGDWPRISKDGTMHNGGLPARANLTAAMTKIDAAIGALPAGFSGALYFDMEDWDPLWSLTPLQYRNASLAWVLQRHPELPIAAATAQAQREYESAAKRWLLAPLESARRAHPRAMVGFYNFPKCANAMGCEQFPPGTNASAENDKLGWLWDASSALFPSIYYDFVWHEGPGPIVRESRRLAGLGKKVLPVWWYYGCGSYAKFCSEANQLQQWRQAMAAGSDGFVVWGGGKPTPQGCRNFESYVSNVLGPVARKFTRNKADDGDVNKGHSDGTGESSSFPATIAAAGNDSLAAARVLADHLSPAMPVRVVSPAQARNVPHVAVGFEAALAMGVSAARMATLGDDAYLVSSAHPVPAGSVAVGASRGSLRGAVNGVYSLLRQLGFHTFAPNATARPAAVPVIPSGGWDILVHPWAPEFGGGGLLRKTPESERGVRTCSHMLAEHSMYHALRSNGNPGVEKKNILILTPNCRGPGLFVSGKLAREGWTTPPRTALWA